MAALPSVPASRVHVAHGSHWLVDCFGVEAARLADPALLEAMLCDAAADAGARRLFQHFHRFVHEADDMDDTDDATASMPEGVTGVVLLAESHITIHTWPERGFAAVDLFLCGVTRPEAAVARIEAVLRPVRIVTVRHERGEPG